MYLYYTVIEKLILQEEKMDKLISFINTVFDKVFKGKSSNVIKLVVFLFLAFLAFAEAGASMGFVLLIPIYLLVYQFKFLIKILRKA